MTHTRPMRDQEGGAARTRCTHSPTVSDAATTTSSRIAAVCRGSDATCSPTVSAALGAKLRSRVLAVKGACKPADVWGIVDDSA